MLLKGVAVRSTPRMPCLSSTRTPPRVQRSQRAVHAAAGGGGVIDRPSDVEIKTQGWNRDNDLDIGGSGPKTETGDGSGNVDKQKQAPRGGGDYRVLLLKSEKHTEKGVVKAILQTIPNTDEAHARNCYQTSKVLGMAIICSVLKEHAEFYSQRLYRLGCKTAIEPDTAAR